VRSSAQPLQLCTDCERGRYTRIAPEVSVRDRLTAVVAGCHDPSAVDCAWVAASSSADTAAASTAPIRWKILNLNVSLAADEVTPLAVIGGLVLWLPRLSLAPTSTLAGFRAWVLEE
jgi:hypothetical protein